jgi:hypothetical protein
MSYWSKNRNEQDKSSHSCHIGPKTEIHIYKVFFQKQIHDIFSENESIKFLFMLFSKACRWKSDMVLNFKNHDTDPNMSLARAEVTSAKI